jgi:hypothetical protein
VSIGQLPYPSQVTFPLVDHAKVTPTSDDVALLVATRTIDSASNELGQFTTDTRPTDAQVDALIQQALTMVLTPLPDRLQESLYPRIREAVAVQAAILVETSFYREQANTGTITALNTRLGAMLEAIQEDAGGAGVSNRVDSIVLRSTMTEYDPYYALPPPPVVGWPISPPPVVAVPALSAVTPASGQDAGGDTLTVTGTGLTAVVRAVIDDGQGNQTAVDEWAVANDELMWIVTPAGQPGSAVSIDVFDAAENVSSIAWAYL